MAEVISRALGDQILDKQPRDYNHADDSQYKELRAAANKELDKAHALSDQSQNAFKAGDKSKAHDLSEEAKQHRSKGEDLNMQAAQWVFRANNADSGPDEIDLHGLFVKESLSALDSRISAARSRNESVLKVITGKGIHSESHQSKLKPAVEDYCRENGLSCHVDQKNTGVIVVDIAGNNNQGQHQNQHQNQNQNQNQNQGQNQNQNQGHNQSYYDSNQNFGHQNQNQNQNQNYNGNAGNNNNNNNNKPDYMQEIKKWIKIFKQVKRAFHQCMG